MKKLIALCALLMAMMVAFSGCSMIVVNEERDNAVVVATVDGVPLYKGDYKELYTQYAQYMGIDETRAESSAYEADMNTVRQSLLDMMVEDEVTWQMTQEFGFGELTADEEAEIQASFDEIVDLALEGYLVDAEGNPIENPTDEQKKAARDKVIEAFGVDEEGYLEDMYRTRCQEKLYNELTDMAGATPEEVQEEYDRLVSEDQTSYQGNQAQYEQAIMNGSVVLYVPAGLRYIKHILVGFDEEASAEIVELREAEYTAEDPEAAALETDARRAELAQELEAEAQEILEKLEKGTITFEEAMEEYSDDTQDPESEGFAVASSGETYDTDFVTNAFKIKKVGEMSDLVLTDFGYHIILYAGDVQPGPKTLEDEIKYGYDDEGNLQTVTVFDYVQTRMVDEEKETLFNAAIKLAVEEAEVKTYLDRVKDVK